MPDAQTVSVRFSCGERTVYRQSDQGLPIRLGIRNFKPTLRKAPERLEALRTPEGAPLPPNTRAEMLRDMARLRFVENQIKEIEAARSQQLEQAPAEGPHAMIRLLARVIGVGVETADMLVNEILSRNLRDQKAVARYAGLTGSPDQDHRAVKRVARPMLGFKSFRSAAVTLAGSELMHMIRKGQLRSTGKLRPAQQFHALAA